MDMEYQKCIILDDKTQHVNAVLENLLLELTYYRLRGFSQKNGLELEY